MEVSLEKSRGTSKIFDSEVYVKIMNEGIYKNDHESETTESLINEGRELDKEPKYRHCEFMEYYVFQIFSLSEKNDVESLMKTLQELPCDISNSTMEQLAPLTKTDFLEKILSLYQLGNKELFGMALNSLTMLVKKDKSLADFFLQEPKIEFLSEVLDAEESEVFPFAVALIAQLSTADAAKCIHFAQFILRNQHFDGNTAIFVKQLVPLIKDHREEIDVDAIVGLISKYPYETTSFSPSFKDFLIALKLGIEAGIEEFINAYHENDFHTKFICMLYDEYRESVFVAYQMLLATMSLESDETIKTPEYIEIARVQTNFMSGTKGIKRVIIEFLLKYVERVGTTNVSVFFNQPEPFIDVIIKALDEEYIVSEGVSILVSKIISIASQEMLQSIDYPYVIDKLISIADVTKPDQTEQIVEGILASLKCLETAGLTEGLDDSISFDSLNDLEETNEKVSEMISEINQIFSE